MGDDNEGEEVCESRNNIFCNNCRKYGHVFNKCKMPVVSYGIILFRNRPRGLEYLMICRRNTLGYIDFLRGKYAPTHKYYIMNMLKQMTREEITMIETLPFDELWNRLWNDISRDETTTTTTTTKPKTAMEPSAQVASYNNQYRIEEYSSRVKFNMLVQGIYTSPIPGSEFFSLKTLLEEIKLMQPLWEVPEWGFPKGRRHYQESEFRCALREFAEETGMSTKHMVPIYNLFPVEEMFIGSNYKSYKHKYFLMYLNDQGRDEKEEINRRFCSEVSQQKWNTLEECLAAIRSYNVEKKVLIQNVDCAIRQYMPVKKQESV